MKKSIVIDDNNSFLEIRFEPEDSRDRAFLVALDQTFSHNNICIQRAGINNTYFPIFNLSKRNFTVLRAVMRQKIKEPEPVVGTVAAEKKYSFDID